MASVTLHPSQQRLFVGAYTPVKVKIDPASGLSFEDLEFVVPDGIEAGLISMARGPGFDPVEQPQVMLLAGSQPGTYWVEAREQGSGAVAGTLEYEVTDLWEGKEVGPPLWFSGEQAPHPAGSAWGGGAPGPQNINVLPARGTRRLAILFVDTSSQRYTSDATVMERHRARWLDEVVRGVSSGGVARSSAAWYREVSYGSFDLSAQAFGPVRLPGTFASYFNADGTPKGSFPQACITAGDSLIDYRQFDTIVCVSQSVPASGSMPMRSAWPYASIGAWGPYSTSEGSLQLGIVSMPNEWRATNNGPIYEAFSHELGHNLGLGDQYKPAVSGRNLGGWDMMALDDPFPHFSLLHRMVLGWIRPEWLRTFDFSTSAAPIAQSVSLVPVETVGREGPPPGRYVGIEVRKTDGLNYYLEYRNGGDPQIGDRQLPTDDRVLGTDVTSPPFRPNMARPSILLLPNDGNDSGAVLGNGDFYRETDHSVPAFPTEFRVDVSGIDGTKADVRVQYGLNQRPDPSIRDWPAPGRRWQSPDIEVRNARNMADPAWRNVPWVGNPNTAVARVKNSGMRQAPQVRVNFFVKNYDMGGAPEEFLGTEVQDIAGGDTVDFSAPWTPPRAGHYCIVVRIPPYVVPTAPAVAEATDLNNLAQSNYDRFVTTTSSPSTRVVTTVDVGNPYSDRARVFIVANQTNPLYRTYLEHTWLWLEPGETRPVQVMFEHGLEPGKDAPIDVRLKPSEIDAYRKLPNDTGFYAYIEDPTDFPRHRLDLLGGADAQVVTGRATQFEELTANDKVVRGRVETVDNGQPVDGGIVLLALDRGAGTPEAFEYVEAAVREGAFAAELGDDWTALRADFLPPPEYGPCTSEWLPRQ